MDRLKSKKVNFARAVVAGNNLTEAAVKAGYKPSAAPFIGSRLNHDPTVKELIAKEMEKQGLTSDVFVTRFKDGVDTPDLDCRHKYLQTWGKMAGFLNDDEANKVQVNLFGTYFDQAYNEFEARNKPA